MYLCQQYHPHHLSTGRPMARDHRCEAPSITTSITTFLTRNTDFWTNLPWACLYCGLVNHGMDQHCTSQACLEETGANRDFVLANLLTKVGQEIATLDEADEAAAEIWPTQKALQVILSPHNREYCGLLTGAFRAPSQEENVCACSSTLDLSTPDTAVTHQHSNTSPPATFLSHLPGTSTTTTPPSPPGFHSSPTLSPLDPLALPFLPPGTSTTTTLPSPTGFHFTPTLDPSTLSFHLPVTSTTTTTPPPPGTSSHLPSSPPVSALTDEPLQAVTLDDTVVEAMDTDTEQPPYHHNYIPHRAEHDRLMEERRGGISEEGREMKMDLVHFGTNGLLTFPPHTTPTETLPTATIPPVIRQEAPDTSDESSDESFDWLEDILHEEEFQQQDEDELSLSPYTLEQLLNLSDTDEDMDTPTITLTAATSTATPATTNTTTTTTVDASNAPFGPTDVRLRVPLPQSAARTTTISTTFPSTHTVTTTTQPSLNFTSFTSTGARPRTFTGGARPSLGRTPPQPPRLRRALLPLPPPPPTSHGPARCPTQLFWWCSDNDCGRANRRHHTHCGYCGKTRETTTVKTRAWGK